MAYDQLYAALIPSLSDQNDGVAYTLANRVEVLAPGDVAGLEVYFAPTAPSQPLVAMAWNDLGAVLRQEVWSGSMAPGRQRHTFSVPLSVGAGVYLFGYWTPGRYVATPNGLTVDLNSPGAGLRALASGGRFNTAGSAAGPVFPNNPTTAIYFADPLFTLSGVDVTAPSRPTGLRITELTESSVSLAWNASTDNVEVSGYDVEVNGVKVATVPGLVHNVTGLMSGTQYIFGVRARDAAGNLSAASNLVAVTTDIPFVVPSNLHEQSVQRMLTHAFITADPTVLQFMRRARVSDGAGGTRPAPGPPQALAPQAVKMTRLGAAGPERYTEDGRAVFPALMLTCYPTTDVKRFDTFTVNDAKWQVVFVTDAGYELRAEVAYLG